MADAAFLDGEIDIQFLERRADLLQPVGAAALDIAVAAALAEDQARRSRIPTVAAEDHASEVWVRQARLEAIQ
jgi:hypothetical protein